MTATLPSLSLTLTAALLFGGGALSAVETDEQIARSFASTHVSRVILKDDAVKATVKDGVITLTGTVAEESHRRLAQDAANDLPGVARVDNRIETRAEAASAGSDAWIAQKVRMVLLFHRNVRLGKTTIEVKDGVVTLKGSASSLAQKDLTAEYAKDVEGVKSVVNELAVEAQTPIPEGSAGDQLDDASITAQVRLTLASHRSTSAARTAVQTRKGEVTLTGIARNAAEKDLVGKLVADIQGVSSVRNQMTVDAAASK